MIMVLAPHRAVKAAAVDATASRGGPRRPRRGRAAAGSRETAAVGRATQQPLTAALAADTSASNGERRSHAEDEEPHRYG